MAEAYQLYSKTWVRVICLCQVSLPACHRTLYAVTKRSLLLCAYCQIPFQHVCHGDVLVT